ncbi:MAG TPA: N-acetylmuramoyl-L-alanine amidase [Planktothrix sp.]|jgi:N-acetylmuramoyl-L-alanine amidase CwlD
MPRASSLRSGFIAAVAFTNLLSCNTSVLAQGLSQPNRVTSCIATQPNVLTIVTSWHTPLPAPVIQYLPGPDDCTVLVADFNGLTWVGPPRVIHPENAPGILEVRVGQFENSPPVCRVSVTSKNPKLFKGVTFQNLTGELQVKWGGAVGASLPTTPVRRLVPVFTADEPNRDGPARRMMPVNVPQGVGEGAPRIVDAQPAANRLVPPSAPSFSGSPSFLPPVSYQPPPAAASSSAFDPTAQTTAAANKTAVAGNSETTTKNSDGDDLSGARPVKPGILHKLASKTEKLLNEKDPKSHDKLTTAEPATVVRDQQPATMKEQAGMPVPDGPGSAGAKTAATPPLAIYMSTDETSVVENLKIDLTAQRKLNYTSFRMHNPERYVIDFDQLPELASLGLPDSDSPLFYRLRSGTLPDKPNTERLVLDLPDDSVQIRDKYDDSLNTLSLMLYRKDSTASGATVNGAPARTSELPKDDKPTTVTVPLAAAKLPGGKVIVLDAGHGGSDPGAQRADVNEKDLTLAIVNKLKKLLEQQGCSVVMTRSDDTFVSLEDRVKITNQVMPDLFLSVHINAMESANDIAGIETYYQTDQSKALADAVHQDLVSGLGAQDRSTRKARFYVINHTQVPAILAEVGFISNKDERQKLNTADYQEKIAESLARGVNVYIASHETGSSHVAQGDSNKPATAEGTTVSSAKSLSSSFASQSVQSQKAF